MSKRSIINDECVVNKHQQENENNESPCWTPEESVNVYKRKKQLQQKPATRTNLLSDRFRALEQEQPFRLRYEARTQLSLKDDMQSMRQEKELAPVVDATVSPFEAAKQLLEEARHTKKEFNVLCLLSMTCKQFSKEFGLRKDTLVPMIQRYITAYMREHVHLRKFEMENTPTKKSLEPYYHFEREHDPTALSENRYPTCTLTAPSVRVCWKGIKGLPPVINESRLKDALWHERKDSSTEWERIKTKTWSIRNPLARFVAMHVQAHENCSHAAEVRNWAAQIKKTWPLAKQRNPWKELAKWHDNPKLCENSL